MTPNEHAARQRDPAQYTELRSYTPKGAPDGLSMVIGLSGDDGGEVQSIHADADKLSAPQFRDWLESHDFDTSNFTEATRKSFDSFARWVPLELQKGREGQGRGRRRAHPRDDRWDLLDARHGSRG